MAGSVGQAFLEGMALPLLLAIITESNKATEHNLVEKASVTLGAVVAHLPWRRYSQTLRNYLRLIPEKPDLERTLVRTCCRIIDACPFALLEGEPDGARHIGGALRSADATADGAEDGTDGDRSGSASDVDPMDAAPTTDEAEKVLKYATPQALIKRQQFMVNYAIPQLFRYLTEKRKTEGLRIWGFLFSVACEEDNGRCDDVRTFFTLNCIAAN